MDFLISFFPVCVCRDSTEALELSSCSTWSTPSSWEQRNFCLSGCPRNLAPRLIVKRDQPTCRWRPVPPPRPPIPACPRPAMVRWVPSLNGYFWCKYCDGTYLTLYVASDSVQVTSTWVTNFISHVFEYPPKWYTYSAGMAGATWNCCCLCASSVYNHAPCHFIQSHIHKVYACLAVTCHLHFWQNDWEYLHATAVTRVWNGYRNKSQHRKLTQKKKILPLLQQGFKPTTFRSQGMTVRTAWLPGAGNLLGRAGEDLSGLPDWASRYHFLIFFIDSIIFQFKH